MGSKRPKMYIRLSFELEDELKKMYRSNNLLLEEGISGKGISFSAFIGDALKLFAGTPQGLHLRGVYNERLYDKEKEEGVEKMLNGKVKEENW